MNRGWIPTFVCLLIAAPAFADLLVDPFLEDLRVGRYEDVDEIRLVEGWPEELFAPAHWSAAWDSAWSRLEDVPSPLLVPENHALDWLAARRADWDARETLSTPPDFLLADVLAKRALDLAGTDPRRALGVVERLLEPGTGARLDEAERFVWSLRRRALGERLGSTGPSDRLWPELLELGPYDRNTAWSIWRARRSALGRPILPAEPHDAKTARFVAGLRSTGLRPRDIDRAPYDADARSALGAAVLPRSSLRRHFGQFPDPPADAADQTHWLRGRWRLLGYTADAAERLAALHGLADEHRAGYLRRAADKQASDGYWGSVIPNLRAARLMARRSGRNSVLNRVNIEIERMAALSAHQGRTRAAALLDELAEDAEGDPRPGRLGLYERRIIEGEAVPLLGRSTRYAPDAARLYALRIWCELGRALAARSGADPRWSAYAARLAEVDDGAFEDAARLVADALEDQDWGEELRVWSLLRRLADDGPTAPPAAATPIPRLVKAATTDFERHLLLGAALVLDDPRGQLAAVVSMPRPGLSQDENLRLLYPLPADADLRRRLDETDLDPALILAVARNESRFDPAVRSRSGALGWMQIMPFHYAGRGHAGGEVVWRRLGASLDAGISLLLEAARRYDGDPYRSLAAYNAGPGAVGRWDAQLGPGAPESTFLAWIGYPETRRYVEKVLIDRAVYAWILGTASTDQDDDADTPSTLGTPDAD